MEEIRKGMADSWPVALGMFPLGLAFGLLITQVGFAWFWAPVFSLAIYAGSMEFLAITLVTGGVSAFSAGLYGLLVNFRHVFYALNYPIERVRGLAARAYGMYSLTDETYAIISSKPKDTPWTTARVMTIQAMLQLGWVGGGVAGTLAGSAVTVQLHGMEFALTALFTVLMIESFAGHKDLSLPLTAVLCALVGLLISADNMLMIGMTVYFLLLLLRHWAPRLDEALRWPVGHTDAAPLRRLDLPGGAEEDAR